MKNILLLLVLMATTSVLVGQSRISFGVAAGDYSSTDLAIDQEEGVIYDDCVVPTGHMFLKEAYVGYAYVLPIKLEIGAKMRMAEGNREFTDRRTQEIQIESLNAYQLDVYASYFFVNNNRLKIGAGAGPTLMYRKLNSATQTELTMVNTGEHQVFAQTIDNLDQSEYEFRPGIAVSLSVQFPISDHLSIDLGLVGSAFCEMETNGQSTSHTGSVGLGYSF